MALVVTLATALLAPGHAQDELQYSVTLRDFLPSFCMAPDEYPVFLEGAPEDDHAWVESVRDRGCPGGAYANMGHPDFEMRWGAFGVTGYGWNLSSPIQSNSARNAPVSAIINRDAGVQYARSGLSKPRYCTDDPAGRCGFARDTRGNRLWITAGQPWFEQWYNDAPRNRRVGALLQVPPLAGQPGVYRFDSNVHSAGFFGPLDFALGSDAAAEAAGLFPATQYERGLGHKFSFTTEIQTWFEYRGDEEFEWSGDDDAVVYVNGALLVDLGGVHSRATTRVQLQGAVAARLNMTVGDVYEFSLFHAERRTMESNFMFTTSLRPSCNVLQSGTLAADSSVRAAASAAAFGGAFVAPRPGYVLDGGALLVLTKPTDAFASRRVFFSQQHNVGTGFVADFVVDIATPAGASNLGFAFVLTRRPQGLVNFPASTGAYLGFRYVSHSVAVVFDAAAGQVRVHYPDRASDFNDALSNATRRVYDGLQMRANGSHTVRVQYLERPDWLEVYIDNSLYLRQRGLDLGAQLGGRSAFAGFTAGTAARPAYVSVRDYTLRAVHIASNRTQFAAAQPSLAAPADGRSAAAVLLQNVDACGKTIAYGGFKDDVQGVFVQVDRDIRPPVRVRRFLRGSNNAARRSAQAIPDNAARPEVIRAGVADNGDGTYAVQLRTLSVTGFELYAAFGRNCSLRVDDEYFPIQNRVVPRVSVQQNGPDPCWFAKYPEAVQMQEPDFIPLPPTMSPFLPPNSADDDNAAAYSRAGLYGGLLLLLLLLVAAALYACFKRKWDRDKAFVPEGEEYLRQKRMHEGPHGRDDPTLLAAQLQRTREAVMRARAGRETIEREAELGRLMREAEDLRMHIRVAKQRQQLRQQDKSDARARALAPLAAGRRARKEFRATEADAPPMSASEAAHADAIMSSASPRRQRRSSSATSASSSINAGAAAFTREVKRRVSATLSMLPGLAKPAPPPTISEEEEEEEEDSRDAPPPPPVDDLVASERRWSWLRMLNEADLVPDEEFVPPPPGAVVASDSEADLRPPRKQQQQQSSAQHRAVRFADDDDDDEDAVDPELSPKRRSGERRSARSSSDEEGSEVEPDSQDTEVPLRDAPPASASSRFGRFSLRSAMSAHSRRSQASALLVSALPPLRPPPGMVAAAAAASEPSASSDDDDDDEARSLAVRGESGSLDGQDTSGQRRMTSHRYAQEALRKNKSVRNSKRTSAQLHEPK